MRIEVTSLTRSGCPMDSDDDAVADLHRELAGQMRGLAWAMLRDWSLAEDAVQEAFLLLATKCREIPIDQRRGWLVRTVQYCSLNLRRGKHRQERRLREQASEYKPGQATLDHSSSLERDEELIALRDALTRLPVEQLAVVRMRLYEDLSFQQIADTLEISLGTVLSRMRLAMEKLRSKLA